MSGDVFCAWFLWPKSGLTTYALINVITIWTFGKPVIIKLDYDVWAAWIWGNCGVISGFSYWKIGLAGELVNNSLISKSCTVH